MRNSPSDEEFAQDALPSSLKKVLDALPLGFSPTRSDEEPGVRSLVPLYGDDKVILPRETQPGHGPISKNPPNSTVTSQGRILLVSLLENFCMLYHKSPQRNRELFFTLCKMLYSMGIIEEEYIEEMAAVRNSYMHVFRELVLQAMHSIEEDKRVAEEGSRLFSLLSQKISSQTGSSSTEKRSSTAKNEQKLIRFEPRAMFGARPAFDSLFDVRKGRYWVDFIELHQLGKGGFGTVYKVRNRLDFRDYAVKKVKLRVSEAPLHTMLREITSLAQLEHPNIVRYYCSWVEYDDESATSSPEGSYDGYFNNNSFSLDSTSDQAVTNNGLFMYESDHELSAGGISRYRPAEVQRLSNAVSTGSVGVEFRHDKSTTDDNTSFSSLATSDPSVRNKSQMDNDLYRSSHQSTPCDGPGLVLTLHIQMQLCTSNLQEFLQHRNEWLLDTNPGADSSTLMGQVGHVRILRLFRGIVEGVAYIHSRNMIHRDLKPSNIFLDVPHTAGSSSSPSLPSDKSCILQAFQEYRDLIPRIGDFGLVTTSKVTVRDSNTTVAHPSETPDISQLTFGVGTITYASPEQLAPTSNKRYDTASDIFSLGIILFELLYPFATGMERVITLKKLREGVFPESFVAARPKETAVILWMMASDPKRRPTAVEILSLPLFDTLITTVTQLHGEVQRHKVEKQQLQLETDELRRKVAALEAQLRDQSI
ncbi:hypothetical protein IWQ62_004910 [Dispira parvispora]|uniref:non-specific serine/threonine protein kinase n=1 Tax=Dispira parvispora TaxID=1520584 RepID=A0A9W8AL01_9FUNG|nr:hypothetical protein IWQ62_004910 [Dispira parvispora]